MYAPRKLILSDGAAIVQREPYDSYKLYLTEDGIGYRVTRKDAKHPQRKDLTGADQFVTTAIS